MGRVRRSRIDAVERELGAQYLRIEDVLKLLDREEAGEVIDWAALPVCPELAATLERLAAEGGGVEPGG
jgi:hypothetical protein